MKVPAILAALLLVCFLGLIGILSVAFNHGQGGQAVCCTKCAKVNL